MWQRRWRMAIVLTVLTVGALAMILPYYWMVISSLKPPEELYAYPPRFTVLHPTFKAYIDLFTILPIARTLFNSLFVATTVTLSNMILCSLAGYAFAKLRFPGRDGIFLALISAMMIPWQVFLIPGFVIVKALGWLNTFWALIVPNLAMPFGIFLCRQYATSIPDGLIEAARIDGYSEWGIYSRIILPLLTPTLATLAIFTFLSQWNSFVWPLIVVQSSDMRTVPLIIGVLNGQFGSNFAMVMAGALVITLPMLVVFLIFQRQFIKGVFLTSIRE